MTEAEIPPPRRRSLLGSALRFLFVYLFSIALLCVVGWVVWVYVHIYVCTFGDECGYV